MTKSAYAAAMLDLGYSICRRYAPAPGGDYPPQYFIGTAAIAHANSLLAGQPVGLLRMRYRGGY